MPSWSAVNVGYGLTFLNTVAAAFKADPGAALVVTGKIRLSKAVGFNPTKDSTRAELAADEADYSGYTAGGIAVSMSDPVNLGTNTIGELLMATPALSDGVMYVRSSASLFAIGKKK